MSTGNFFKSDLESIHHVVQNTMIIFPKEIVIEILRDYFSKDSYYHFVKDQWGFANTTDHTDLPLDAGLNDDLTTRVFVGENYRNSGIFYPAILIKNGGGRAAPISLNREDSTVFWEVRQFEDGYGNVAFFKTPKSFIFAGAWEGSIIIEIVTRSLRSRDDLVELVMMCLTDISYKSLEKAGVAIKQNQSWSAPSEENDRSDKLFRQTITLEIRSEWRREIPVGNIIDTINFAVEFGYIQSPTAPMAQNLTINTNISLIDIMAGETLVVQSE